MYHYIEDKAFLKRMRGHCSGIINQLVQRINSDSVISVKAHLIGSGARNLITQNGSEPIDLDYNLCIVDCFEINPNNGREVKEYIRKQFNLILNRNGWDDCQDSTSALSTGRRYFKNGNRTGFSIDLAILRENYRGLERLIHNKTGLVVCDEWYWNQAPRSGGLANKAKAIKDEGLWLEVRDLYLEKKNMYLCRGDRNHPSFIVYTETINEIYYKCFR